MSWLINLCDVSIESDYKIAIIKGLATMLLFFIFGFLIGRVTK